MTQNDENKDGTKKDAEDRLLEAGEQTMAEMQDAMATMMSASTKMMQSFVDMRMSYLQMMRAGLEDPQTSFDMASKNMQDLANAVKKRPK
ncbi:MAG: hypothetical protein ABJM29_12815 [Rhizobiaceae bacterium]